MARIVKFTKMHGAGNDYIYVDTLYNTIPDPAEAARRWSDRHRGIGSDGLVLIGRSGVPEADFTMRIFNADGSEARMCGNASRCIGKYVYDKGLTDKASVRLLTLAGVKTLELLRRSQGLKRGRFLHNDLTSELYEVFGTHVLLGTPQIEKYADSLQRLSQMFLRLEEKKEAFSNEEVEAMFSRVRDKVCGRCGKCDWCWGENFIHTYQMGYDILSAVDSHGFGRDTIDMRSNRELRRCAEVVERLKDVTRASTENVLLTELMDGAEQKSED